MPNRPSTKGESSLKASLAAFDYVGDITEYAGSELAKVRACSFVIEGKVPRDAAIF